MSEADQIADRPPERPMERRVTPPIGLRFRAADVLGGVHGDLLHTGRVRRADLLAARQAIRDLLALAEPVDANEFTAETHRAQRGTDG